MAGPYYLGQGQYREGSGGNSGGYVVTAPIAVSNLKINESFFEPGEIKDILRIEPGQSVTFSFTIVNMGRVVDWFWLAVIGVPSTWVQQQPSLTESIKLNPQDPQTVKLTIAPPREPESRAGHYFLRIQVVGQRAPGQLDIITGTLEVLPFYEFRCDLLPLQPSSVAEGIYEVVVSNDGNTDLVVKLEAREIGRQSRRQCDYDFERRPLLTIPAAQARSVNLIVRAKQWPVAEAKTHPFVLMATRLNSEQREAKEGSWEQTQPNFRLTLQPKRREAVGKGSFMVLVSNYSEVDLDLALAGEDEEQGCQYVFDPARVTARANEEAEVDLIIRPAVRLRRRDPKLYPFTITAWPINAPEVIQKVEGEWVQLPSAFKWLPVWRLLLALLIVLIMILIGFYFLLIKPPPLLIRQVEVTPAAVVRCEVPQDILSLMEPVTETVVCDTPLVTVGLEVEYENAESNRNKFSERIRKRLADWISPILGEPAAQWVRNEIKVRVSTNDIPDHNFLTPASSEGIVPIEPTVTPALSKARGVLTATIERDTTFNITAFNSLMAVSTAVLVRVYTPTPTTTPTFTPTSTPTPTLTPTPVPPCQPSVKAKSGKIVPVRLGPGEEYELLDEKEGSSFGVINLRSRNPENTWWQIEYSTARDGFAWIPSDPNYYENPTPCNVNSLPVAQGPATATPTPTATATLIPTATPTPYYYFEVSISPERETTCALLQWEVRYVDKVYLQGLQDTSNLLPAFPGRPELIGAPGEPRQGPREDCPDGVLRSSTTYAMHVFHWGDGHECKISYTFSETDRFFVKTFDDCHKEGQ